MRVTDIPAKPPHCPRAGIAFEDQLADLLLVSGLARFERSSSPRLCSTHGNWDMRSFHSKEGPARLVRLLCHLVSSAKR
ncbi:hypothetical protein O3S81_03430 [Agrobacterium sp. SOY23]|uniref:hypothetical protein n=1 Tax=Agrobacterium sp. SOY23 TaxID=3014555 RepID=UPI0022B06762|nr:hypothetical protein [Agrobacterium sp. SOY23]MCZ4428745.1 hypothetical protein [Agrobacterium sp. SOY23]